MPRRGVAHFTGCVRPALQAHIANIGGGGDGSVVLSCVSWHVYTYNTEMTRGGHGRVTGQNVDDIYSNVNKPACQHNGHYEGQQND